MFKYISLFFIHYSTWVFLYILPLLITLTLVIIVNTFFRKYTLKKEKERIKKGVILIEAERKNAMIHYTLRIDFILKAFFLGLVLTTIALGIFLVFFEV